MTRFFMSRMDGKNFHSKVRFNFYLLTKRDITADSIYMRALDFLGELDDLEIVNVSDQIEISLDAFNKPREVIKPYTGDSFRSYAMSMYLEDIFKTCFCRIDTDLLDIPRNNDTEELRRVILESKHISKDLSNWAYDSGYTKVSITLDIEHKYMLRRKGINEIDLIEYNSDVRENHNKSVPLTRCYVIDKVTGVEKRVDDLALEVPIDKSHITEQLNQVKINFPDRYISSIDFVSDDFPDNLIISKYSCKELDDSIWESNDDDYLWSTTYDAARFLINSYCNTYSKVVLRLSKRQYPIEDTSGEKCLVDRTNDNFVFTDSSVNDFYNDADFKELAINDSDEYFISTDDVFEESSSNDIADDVSEELSSNYSGGFSLIGSILMAIAESQDHSH